MTNETLGSLVWSSPAGVMVQAVDLAGRSDRSKRGQATGTLGARATRTSTAGTGLPMPLAVAGLVFVGFALSIALVATVIS